MSSFDPDFRVMLPGRTMVMGTPEEGVGFEPTEV